MALLVAALFMAALLSPFGTRDAEAQTTPETHVIEALDDGNNNRWDQPNVTVEVGDTVQWQFDQAAMPHTVTNDSPNWTIDEYRDPGSTDTVEYTFTEPGEYKFLCSIHTGMTGTVTVVDSGGGDPPPATLENVMVFSKTAGFRHSSIPNGIAAIEQLGTENGFEVDATEDATQFNDANLAQYDAVVFLSTTGDVLDNEQQGAFERYIAAGGGYVGIHAAADTEYDWNWYGEMLGGAYFQSHPENQQATVKVEDATHPSTTHLPADWSRFDEWYNYRANPRDKGVKVLATLDETSYQPRAGAMGADHPISWCTNYGGGRSWYTGMGHTEASFTEENFTKHVLGGIQWAGGAVDADCGEPREAPPSDNDFEQVTLAKGVPNVGEPSSLSVLPDGRVLHNSRDGKIFLTRPNGSTSLAAQVPIYSHDEDGLQQVQIDPNFEQNGWVYIYYAPPLDTPTGDAPNEGTAADFAAFDGHNQLSRVKMVGDTLDMSTEQKLLQVEADRGICCHAGGSIDFDADGNLYLSTGDDSNPFASDGYTPIDERPNRNPAYDAQRSSANTNDLRGKVIRIKPDPTTADYTVPAGNLFDEVADTNDKTRPEIYAMGFRNPFRMTVDKETGYVYVGEYGPDAGAANPNRGPGGKVEFNQIREAGNFGWPYCTADNTAANTYNDYNFPTGPSGAKFNCDAPVNESPNNTGLTQLPAAEPAWIHYDGNQVTYNGKTTGEFGNGGEGPMAGPVYNYDASNPSEVKFPEFYDNHFFAGEWTRGWIKNIAIGANGEPNSISPFFDSATIYSPMDMEFGPDGSLYVLDYGNGGYFTGNENSAVYKINYVSGARSPIAQASAVPTSGSAPLEVEFSSEGSIDPDGTPLTYEWDFQDDGTIDSTDPNPTFTYNQDGDYTARLTVTDESGKTGNATASITVGNTRPTVEIELPPDGSFFEFGDDVPYKVTVTDPEDGTNIDCTKVEINYILGHDSHGHPLSGETGCEGTLTTVKDEGHGDSANIFGVINARYTDGGSTTAGALTGEDEAVLQPKRKQAEFYTSTGRAPDTGADGDPGVGKETTGDTQGGGQNIGFIEDGDYVSFTPMNLLNISSMTFRVASGGAGGTIQVRLDSPDGPLVAETENITPTGGWQTYKNVNLPIPATEGTHELFFVFRGGPGGLMNMNWIDFNGRGASTNARPQVEATATPDEGEAPLEVAFDGTATDADGEDLTYEWDFESDGTVDATTLDATHTYTEPGSYMAKLTATDPKGASDSVTVNVLVLQACGVVRSDEFEGNALDRQRWTVIRGDDTYSVADGQLALPIAKGGIYGNGEDTNPSNAAKNIIVQQAPSGAWQATAKITAEVSENYHQAGLRLYSDDSNWASVHLISAGGQRDIEFIYENNDQPRNAAEDKVASGFPDGSSTYYVRLTSDGTDLTASYSTDGQTFQPVGRPAPMSAFANPQIGPAALSDAAMTAPNANFDWIRITPDAGGSADAAPSDEFDGATLDKCRWNTIVREDASKYKVENGALSVTTTPGDIYQTPNTDPNNFILQSAGRAPAEDFVMETRLSGTITDGYAQGGLMFYGDDGNYVKLDAIADQGGEEGRIERIELRSETNDAISEGQPQLAAPANVSNYTLRLTKTGNDYKGEVAFDGGDWQTVGTVSNARQNMDFGLFTMGVNQPDRVVNFDYFRATAAGEPPDNAAPVADDDSATTQKGQPVDINVLEGDTDADGDTLTVESATQPTNGATSINGDGTVKYTPDTNFSGKDSFDYTINDGNGGTDTGKVNVRVTAPCDTPAQPEAGYEMLFDGSAQSLEDWEQSGPGSFEHDGCTIKSVGGLGLLWHTNGGQEFEAPYSLKLEWMKPGDDNSGVFVGFSDPGSDPFNAVNDGEEIQIDSTDASDSTTGAIYKEQAADTAARDAALKPDGQWNEYEIKVEADRIIVFLNGTKINEWVDDDPNVDLATGYVGVQNHGDGDDVFFRSIRINDGTVEEPDTKAPNTRITSGPRGSERSSSAAFEFTSTEENSTFECSLDGSGFSECSSPMEYTDLDEGRHVFTVRAVDASGNKDASPAKRIWKVDTIKPKAEDFTPEAGSRTSDRTPSVGAVVSDEGSDLSRGDIRLRMDGREIRSFSYDRDTDRLEYVPSGKMDRGVHAVKIMVRDDAGNRAEETWRFEVVKRQD